MDPAVEENHAEKQNEVNLWVQHLPNEIDAYSRHPA